MKNMAQSLAVFLAAWDAAAREVDHEEQGMTAGTALALVSQDHRGASIARLVLADTIESFMAERGLTSREMRLRTLLRRVAQETVCGHKLVSLGDAGNGTRWGVRVVDARAAS